MKMGDGVIGAVTAVKQGYFFQAYHYSCLYDTAHSRKQHKEYISSPAMSQNVHSECHPPSATSQSNFRMVPSSPTTACGSSVLNLASILNPMPSFDSESDSSGSIARMEDSSAHRTATQNKAIGLDQFPFYTHSSSSPHKPTTPSTHISNNRPATTLIWQPVETPRDHGGVERTLYQESSSLPPAPYKMQNSSYTNGSSDTSSPSSCSGGGSSGFYYYYHHYPTPESPGFQHNEMERKRSFHEDTTKTTEPAAFKQMCRDDMSHEKRHKNKILASKKGQLSTCQDAGTNSTGIFVLDSPQLYDHSLHHHSSQPLEIQFAINNDSLVVSGINKKQQHTLTHVSIGCRFIHPIQTSIYTNTSCFFFFSRGKNNIDA